MPADSSHPGMCVFIYAYVSIFAIAGFLLYGPAWVPKTEEGAAGVRGRRPGRPASTFGHHLEEAPDPSLDDFSAAGGVAAYLARRNDQRSEGGAAFPIEGHEGATTMACSAVHSATDLEFVAGGWTKAVYKAKVHGKQVAIKTVNLNGHDVRECQRVGGSMAMCYRRAAAKILREIILLTELRHENVVQVLGSCVPDAVGPVAMVTELGDPLDTVRLLQLSWEDRLRLALGMARILHRLAHSPLGSLAMNDFRRQQFVLVGGSTLKLSDVDDVGVSEPSCRTSEDCLRYLPPGMINDSAAANPSLPCKQGFCVGHNERINVWHAGRHFISLFLPLSAPSSLKPHIQELLEAYRRAIWSSEEILDATERLVDSFVSGEYRKDLKGNPSTVPISISESSARSERKLQSLGFERVPNSDLPGMFDYRCHDSTSAVGCVISVFNEVEAAELCSKDPNCKAVVLGQEHTWTGRTIAIFKNGYGTPSTKMGYSLLLRKR